MNQPHRPDWDHFARVQASRQWRQQSAAMGRAATEAIVAEAQIEPGLTCLDVASGTGEPAISIATLMGNRGRVVATDISTQPLKIAAERAQQRGLTNIEFQPADVHALQFPDRSFDRVTSRLGIMFFADPARAFREIYRVLRPGGRASFLAWGPFFQPYFTTTIGTLMKELGVAELPASGAAMFKFSDPAELARQLEQAGFVQAEARLETLPWTWPGPPNDVWGYFQDVTAPFKPLMQSVPEEQRDKVEQAVCEAMKPYYDGEEIKFTALMVLASAIK